MVEVENGVVLRCGVCALDWFKLVTGVDLECPRELRVGVWVVSVLLLFSTQRLYHSLRVYGFSVLVGC